MRRPALALPQPRARGRAALCPAPARSKVLPRQGHSSSRPQVPELPSHGRRGQAHCQGHRLWRGDGPEHRWGGREMAARQSGDARIHGPGGEQRARVRPQVRHLVRGNHSVHAHHRQAAVPQRVLGAGSEFPRGLPRAEGAAREAEHEAAEAPRAARQQGRGGTAPAGPASEDALLGPRGTAGGGGRAAQPLARVHQGEHDRPQDPPARQGLVPERRVAHAAGRRNGRGPHHAGRRGRRHPIDLPSDRLRGARLLVHGRHRRSLQDLRHLPRGRRARLALRCAGPRALRPSCLDGLAHRRPEPSRHGLGEAP
mmetsp:Transcript_78871/g.209443  ORF Transcript_78871/g.209443 Transcript_78871/m.209443 type:complete len:312 (+) Transcript_78871:465-1400(+)